MDVGDLKRIQKKKPGPKWIVIVWGKKDGVCLDSEQVEACPISKNGLVVQEKKIGGIVVQTCKDKISKENQFWEGRVEGLFGKRPSHNIITKLVLKW